MKRRAVVLVLLAVAALAAAEPVDLVVMIDKSASMAPYFTDVVDYFIGDLMRNMLQSGDTFRLLSFAGLPDVEMQGVRIDGTPRAEIINKIRLMQPIGLYTDLVSAVLFLKDFTEKLPVSPNRELLIITDGVHDPPPGSPYYGDQSAALAKLLDGARSIRKNGWYVHILGLPLRPADADGQEHRSLLEPLARELGATTIPYTGPGGQVIEPGAAGLLEVRWPGALGTVRRSFAVPLTVENATKQDLSFTLSGLLVNGSNLLRSGITVNVRAGKTAKLRPIIDLPADLQPGDHAVSVRLQTEGPARLYPLEGTLTFRLGGPVARTKPGGSAVPQAGAGAQPGAAPAGTGAGPRPAAAPGAAAVGTADRVQPGAAAAATRETGGAGAAARAAGALQAAASAVGRGAARLSLRIVVPLLLILAAAALIVLLALRLARHGSMPLSRPVMRHNDKGPLIEMLVSLQNSRVGFRNIRGLLPGQRRSVGGGWSAFLIFLVPLPRRVAELRFDGKRYAFRVVRPRYFPSITQEIPDCLGVDIPLVSDKGFPIIIRFVRYVSPLERIHRLLRAVYAEGVSTAPRDAFQAPPVDTAHRFL